MVGSHSSLGYTQDVLVQAGHFNGHTGIQWIFLVVVINCGAEAGAPSHRTSPKRIKSGANGRYLAV